MMQEFMELSSLGDTSARSIVLSVSPCRGVWGKKEPRGLWSICVSCMVSAEVETIFIYKINLKHCRATFIRHSSAFVPSMESVGILSNKPVLLLLLSDRTKYEGCILAWAVLLSEQT